MGKSIQQSIQKKLPDAYQHKAKKILKELQKGKPYRTFQGRRFRWNRNLIGIPLGKHFRIVCQVLNREIVPLYILTHAEYDRLGKPRKSLSQTCP